MYRQLRRWERSFITIGWLIIFINKMVNVRDDKIALLAIESYNLKCLSSK